MKKVHDKLLILGKFMESETPVADLLVPQFRKIVAFLRALLTNNNIHNTVKVFVGNLLSHFDHNSRFKEFPGIFLAACLINPQKSSRDCLTSFEMSIAKPFIHSLRDQVEETSSQEDVIDTALQQIVAAENSIDNIFESIHFAERMHIANAEPRSLGEELEFFMTTINESKTAYQFFKSKRAEFPHLSQIARIILCTYLHRHVLNALFQKQAICLKHGDQTWMSRQ